MTCPTDCGHRCDFADVVDCLIQTEGMTEDEAIDRAEAWGAPDDDDQATAR